MANIEEIVGKMPKEDVLPPDPGITPHPGPPELTGAKIQTIAKELALPSKYGNALHRVARLHGVGLGQVREIEKALKARQKEFKDQDAPKGKSPVGGK